MFRTDRTIHTSNSEVNPTDPSVQPIDPPYDQLIYLVDSLGDFLIDASGDNLIE